MHRYLEKRKCYNPIPDMPITAQTSSDLALAAVLLKRADYGHFPVIYVNLFDHQLLSVAADLVEQVAI